MNFSELFQQLTGKQPFPWQQALYDRFAGNVDGGIPQSCSLPTGLGKTSVVAVWLIALATHPARVPRRLVYVVNRRTVVDQTTEEVQHYRSQLQSEDLKTFAAALRQLYLPPGHHDQQQVPLAISTLRGDFADNGEWCEDPARPAVICGTVDMIGSRLLFSGYGIGRARRPLHAGFLGQDTLLVHDEAHLEPAFQVLIETIQQQQEAGEPVTGWPRLKVMELTATSKSRAPFALSDADFQNPIVSQRMDAAKELFLHPLADAKKPEKELSDKALSFRDSQRAILVFAQSVDTVHKVCQALEKAKLSVRTLTGTMRGRERDKLVSDPIFQRFLPDSSDSAKQGTVYLVCTSAGEVGVNMSADHLICDLTPFDSMAQRFGRVNRFGCLADSQVHVYVPQDWDEKNPLTEYRKRTLALLEQLNGNASPRALGQLPAEEKSAAFTPPPAILPATDMLFDAWTLTTIPGRLPGRPAVDVYLHGLPQDWDPPRTEVAWRTEVEKLQLTYSGEGDREQLWEQDSRALAATAAAILEDYPLKPMELLSDRRDTLRTELGRLAQKHPEANAWLVDPDGEVTVYRLAELDVKEKRDGRTVFKVDSDNCIIVLPPHVGGLSEQGMFSAEAEPTGARSLDVADELVDVVTGLATRCRTMDRADAKASGMQLIRSVAMPTGGGEEAEAAYWHFFVRRNSGQVRARKPVLLDVHVADVERRVTEIVAGLRMDPALAKCLILAARYHDHGKRRSLFQTMLGNRRAPAVWWAKSGPKTGLPLEERYRHEFGSLHDVPGAGELGVTDAERELVLHLIAAHHGRARPHFPGEEVFDPNSSVAGDTAVAASVPQRFGRLQRQFGRWGLAYLESLLRAADWSASANPSAELEETV